jgi:hypothetical protein
VGLDEGLMIKEINGNDMTRTVLKIPITPSLQPPAEPDRPMPRGTAMISAAYAVPEPSISLAAQLLTL